ncbi:MAG: hypothetical protein K9H64_03720 [Bacteroidales bacterium]|nr:hypothetical protein [Bacteroidales bacterium]MCF8454942.1 hypothetical protein [Bacteroidales bacterium]
MKRITFILFLLLIANYLFAQNYGLSIGSATGCDGDAIEIDVTANNLNTIGAITLFIEYMPDRLVFDTLTSLHPMLAAMIYNDVQGGTPPASIGKIGFAWSGFNPANLGNDIIFKLHFSFIGPTAEIGFSSACEIVDTSATILPVTYSSGQISYSDTVEILAQPQPETIIDNGIALFSINTVNVNSFSWQMLDNGIWQNLSDNVVVSGSSSPTLSLYNPGLDWNGRCFRCYLEGCNTTYSDSALLQVFLGIDLRDETTFDWEIIQSPETSSIKVNSTSEGNLSLSLVTLDGKAVENIFSGNIHVGLYEFKISTKPKNTGYYFLKLDFLTTEQIIHQTKKLYLQTL